jgi:hypothetical protein
MAQLVDKNGVVAKVGDKVRTPDGDVVELLERLPRRRQFAMANCEIVDPSTPVDEGAPATEEQFLA